MFILTRDNETERNDLHDPLEPLIEYYLLAIVNKQHCEEFLVGHLLRSVVGGCMLLPVVDSSMKFLRLKLRLAIAATQCG